MTSLEGLHYEIVRNIEDWDTHHNQILKKQSTYKDIVALSHTAKQIGQLNITIVWYLSTSN